MRAALSDRGALLGDFGVGLGAALGGKQRRARIDALGRRRFPAAGATLDLDLVNQQGYAYGQGLGRIRDLVTLSGGAGGTVMRQDGLIVSASAPRFDHDPVSLACKGLLIEEQRTNLLTYSAQRDNAPAWSKTDTTVTADALAGPDGTTAVDLLTEGSAGTAQLVQAASVVANTTLTYSDVFKRGNHDWIAVAVRDAANPSTHYVRAFFNLASGTVGTVDAGASGTGQTASIEDEGGGFYRCRLSGKPGTTATSAEVVSRSAASDGSSSRVNGATRYAWAAQLEAGAYATSYIPTTSVAVTRTADSAVIIGTNFSSWFNASEGTFVVEFDTINDNQHLFGLATDSNNRMQVYRGGSVLSVYIASGGVSQWADSLAGAIAADNKVAFAYKANDCAAVLNGGAVLTDGAVAVPTVPSLAIGRYGPSAGYEMGGHIRRIRYWPRRLSNAELVELSS